MKQKTVVSLPETKSEQMNFYLSRSELNTLTERAEETGLSRSALIRLGLAELFKGQIIIEGM